MSHETEAKRGLRAEEVLTNEVYVEAYRLLEQEVISKWRASRNQDEREQLHQLLLMLGKVQNALETVMRTGQLAQAELDRKRTRAEQIGDVLNRRSVA